MPSEVVGARREVGEEEQATILAVLRGEVAIPVYSSEEGVQSLGRPLGWKEAAELLDSPRSSNSSLLSSPSSPLRSPAPRSPLPCSPLSSVGGSPLPSPTLAALLGPLPAERAPGVAAAWRGGAAERRERLEEPGRGAGRQGRRLAAKEAVGWREWWAWLGDWADLAAGPGLAGLEAHLQARQAEQGLRERMGEVEELEELDNQVFQGLEEVEVATAPLSPLSSLTSIMDNMNLERTGPATPMRPLEVEEEVQVGEVRAALAQVEAWVGRVVPVVADRVGEVMGEVEAVEVGEVLTPHWLSLRRTVNNWRSDPCRRWQGLDFTWLAGRVVAGLVEGLELELEGLAMSRLGEGLALLATREARGAREQVVRLGFTAAREAREEGEVGVVREVQGLVGALATLLTTGALPPDNTLARLWDLDTATAAVTTARHGSHPRPTSTAIISISIIFISIISISNFIHHLHPPHATLHPAG